MAKQIKNLVGVRFFVQPLDVPVILLHLTFLWFLLMTLVSAIVLVGMPSESGWDFLCPCVWAAVLSCALRDVLFEHHCQQDMARAEGR